MTDRKALVGIARKSILKGSKSFAAASHLFDRETRERVWLLYAWCRRCDDIVDAQDHGGALGPQDGMQERLQLVREKTALAFAGRETGEPAFDALGVVARETGLTLEMAGAVIEGFALDAADWQPHSEADLMRYCWHVAGAVGVMMAVVMGVSPDDADTLDRACDLGLAFQLANIARDIEEDDAAGRCYIPLDWMAEEDIPPGEQMKPHYRPALTRIVARMCRTAHVHQCSARIGAARLKGRQRWAILAAAGIYGEIAREVERRGDHAWDHRTVVSNVRKLGFIGKAAWAAVRPVPRSCLAAASERKMSRQDLMDLARHTRPLA
ncbi:farnesyl-diphosphate farnesyltransferase [Novosphingobium aromaticivorans DSM 12444]|uniref:Farnesyl-diphosphate farnesyltransferase n=1 Tax=Novosphingobium aromaticivorans (strain ATCC 700278 / DSM 12444 / CCUG 56034 / CIP 105152 / NBRC 16084 / F199) TaxID=279238 RepID=Q2G7B9_NOVAD|nr:phytoene/squalene synthase family protein [Novosphingobium aromaticivorans]ABD26254.1 farnesyl-diphosphate farnesyltransferase [Novosphingobium aromaticivorans DSM 12444]SCY56218.1 phytoene synthase [Novosphingobium aromaticivorans]